MRDVNLFSSFYSTSLPLSSVVFATLRASFSSSGKKRKTVTVRKEPKLDWDEKGGETRRRPQCLAEKKKFRVEI